MYVDISDSAVELVEPNDFTRFHVQIADGVTEEALDALLASSEAGSRSGKEQVAVDVVWLRAAARDTTVDWTDRFEQMLAYAGSKGWLTEAGTAVSAHIVRL